MLSKEELSELLKSKNLRVTKARLCVLEHLIEASEAMSHVLLVECLQSKGINLDSVTIYRTLHSLTETGIIHKITGVDRSFHYAFARTDHKNDHKKVSNHPHFTCQKCTHTFCLPELSSPIHIDTPEGFEYVHAEITLVGYCPECT